MESKEIGVVRISYDKHGVVTEASFNPTMKINLEPKVLLQLSAIKGSEDHEAIHSNAAMVMATWFNKMNEIELADRNKYEIVSELFHCEKYSDGKVKECAIYFIFKEIKNQLQNESKS